MSLLELWGELPTPAPADQGHLRFAAVPVTNGAPHRLGRSPDGEPALLILSSSPGRRAAPIELRHITVQHDVLCKLQTLDGSSEEANFTVISFSGGESELRNYFLRIGSVVVEGLGESPSPIEVHQAVGAMVNLFRALAHAPNTSVQGLWAEVFLIARAADPVRLVRAWHATPSDRYDFNEGPYRLEVKSAAGRVRRHHFRLDQLLAPADAELLVASVLVERAGGGVTLNDMVGQIQTRLHAHPALSARVLMTIADSLGEAAPAAMQVGFDWLCAQSSLAFYRGGDIPRPNEDLPQTVTEVAFVADLTNAPTVALDPWPSGLFAAARAVKESTEG